MRIELSYGRTHLAAELPDERVVAVLEPAVADGGEPDQEALVAAALASPVKRKNPSSAPEPASVP